MCINSVLKFIQLNLQITNKLPQTPTLSVKSIRGHLHMVIWEGYFHPTRINKIRQERNFESDPVQS
jgi:hypothetical protein